MITVVAGILTQPSGQILMAQRPEGKAMAGLWEFPGGKLEAQETPEAALCRELKEELGITLHPHDCIPFRFVSHAYETFHLLMLVYHCTAWQGELQPLEHQALRWVTAEELAQLSMPAADIPLIKPLQQLMKSEV